MFAEITLNDIPLPMPNGTTLHADEVAFTVYANAEDMYVDGPIHVAARDPDDREINLMLPARDPIARDIVDGYFDRIYNQIGE